MKKHWVIGTGLLLLAGAVGFVAVLLDVNREKHQTSLYKAQYGTAADEYVRQYLEWSKLPGDERLENQWGQGEYGGPQIQQRLKEQQPGRLKADISELATGPKVPAVLADILYGNNWRQAVTQYKKRTEIRDNIATASSVSFLAGIIVIVGYAGTCATRKIGNTTKKRRIKTKKKNNRQPQDSVIEAQTETDLVSEIIAGGDSHTDRTDDEPDNSLSATSASKKESIGSFQSSALQQQTTQTLELKESLRSQASSIAPQTPLEQTAQLTDKVATLMSTAPVSQDLTELTQEVSAIRQFAADQQDRVRQLQDGYDWGIIKRFCLRIIRCIDNLDERIDKLDEQGVDTQGLEDVRDELIFSLESSGVEQYRPDINSSYKGLEKLVEAVKGRLPADDPELVGKIARVVRPGYQYAVNEDDVKIVRCSQVKLYGETS